MTLRARYVLACALLLAASPLRAQPVLDGWRGYKFGMTMDQTQRVPGLIWNEKQMASHTSEDGHPVTVDMTFNKAGKLASIGLEFDGDFPRVWSNLTPAQCLAKYEDILHGAETQYGAFAPRMTPREKGLTIRTLPGAKSRYSYLVNTPHPIGGLFMADAARYYGARFAVAQMVNMDFGRHGSSCALSLAFLAPDLEDMKWVLVP